MRESFRRAEAAPGESIVGEEKPLCVSCDTIIGIIMVSILVKNIDYIGHNTNVVIGDWLDEGMGGYYRQQPALVSRKKDFIEVTSKANPDQITQILQHEYNHMVHDVLNHY